ncbi:MAG: DUF2784 domain-containing protein [Acidobacteriota bacterium]
MQSSQFYSVLADLVVVVHLAYAGFVLFGFVAVLLGRIRGWRWTRQRMFRWTHLICTAFVAVEAVFGLTCPLTVWENQLLRAAGESGYDRSFIGELASNLLFYDAPEWMFTLVYLTLTLAVLLVYFVVPPQRLTR